MLDSKIIKAVIFDYDGVIVNSDPFSKWAFKETLLQKDMELTEDMYQKYFAGRKLQNSLQLLLEPLGRADEVEEFAHIKRSFDESYVEQVTIYPDAPMCITYLESKFRLAVATGARRVQVESVLERHKLLEKFEAVVSAEDYKEGKPSPHAYLEALQRLGISSQEAVAIEDSPSGIASAKTAQIFCIGITSTHPRSDLEGADLVVDSLLEIQ